MEHLGFRIGDEVSVQGKGGSVSGYLVTGGTRRDLRLRRKGTPPKSGATSESAPEVPAEPAAEEAPKEKKKASKKSRTGDDS